MPDPMPPDADPRPDDEAAAEAFWQRIGPAAKEARGEDDPHITRLITKLKGGDFSPVSAEAEAQAVLDEPAGAGRGGRLGKFEISGLIAAGGMGLVFAGRDPDLHREVAIKALAPRLAGDPDSRERFLREARAAAALDHPNILPIHSVEEGERAPFIVMPRVESTLATRIAEHGPLSPERAAALFAQAADALAAAHRQSIIHRDIKPANLLLDAAGETIFVADFGIAQHGGGGGGSDSAGTPAFAAPERTPSERSDIFSLGASLRFACTGSAECDDADAARKLPRWLRTLIAEMTAADPAARPDSAAAIARRLRRGRGLGRKSTALAAAAAALAFGAAALTPIGVSGWINRGLCLASGDVYFADGRVGTYDSLRQAIGASGGGTVFLDYDGERETPPVEVQVRSGGSLVLKAVPGRAPVLVQKVPQHPLISTRWDLRLEGLALVRPARFQRAAPLLRSFGASVEFRRCLVAKLGVDGAQDLGGDSPIQVFGIQARVAVEESIFCCGRQPWLFRRAVRPNGIAKPYASSLRVADSILFGRGLDITGNPELDFAAEFERTVIAGGCLVKMRAAHPLRVKARRCVLAPAFTAIYALPMNLPAAEARLSWDGEGNAWKPDPSGGFARLLGEQCAARSLAEWGELSFVAEPDPAECALSPEPVQAMSLPDLRAALREWAQANRASLGEAGAPALRMIFEETR